MALPEEAYSRRPSRRSPTACIQGRDKEIGFHGEQVGFRREPFEINSP